MAETATVYHLTIEPNTVFAKFPPQIPEDDAAYAMLLPEELGALHRAVVLS